jgi:hypothetical protein
LLGFLLLLFTYPAGRITPDGCVSLGVIAPIFRRNTMNTSNTSVKYFNLHTAGIGYVSRIREVPVKRGAPFLACNISALHGAADAVEYTKFDCRVSGGEAEKLIRRCMDAVAEEKKVLVGFNLGDLYPDLYTKADGSPAVSLKARLLRIDWIKVDGQNVYTVNTD